MTMQENIKKLADYIMADIEAVRAENKSPDDRLGIEIVALNALCGAERTLKDKCQSQ
ncbi:hypothetical protein [Clostridium sp. AF24-2LB]|jgi:hypothetical protein|uniref:hypothetical protein n=1 Tax=Clostridium sp. AF24-2LB TaxID=2293007 RepID=UPI0015FBF956|nr:hypothetical protein [Clostridium sp. AF24-2LB]